MTGIARLCFAALFVTCSLIDFSSVSAFAIAPLPSTLNTMKPSLYPRKGDDTILRIRGGGPASPPPPATKVASSASASDAGNSKKAGKPKKRVRISAFDSMRGILALMIVFGHFIRFANPSQEIFRFFSQHNVIVGAFFALSGYVTAYTSTEVGQRAASPKLLDTPKQKWILSRIFGFYPLHLLVLFAFSPIFLYADVHYTGWLKAIQNGILSITLTQAWFPMQAEVWNAPTWYLSALAFGTAIMPFGLPSIAKMDKPQLRRTAGWLFLVNLLPKLGYLYDMKAWSIMEGVVSPKNYPNLAVFNMLRFSPLNLVSEVVLGAVACRLVMMDSDTDRPKTNMMSTLGPLLGMLLILTLRAVGFWEFSDMLVRPVLFVPIFLRFLMSAHRNTVNGIKDPTTEGLSNPVFLSLGNLSFPVFIVHGPLGQMFFKKLIATKLFGKVLKGPEFFGLYVLTVLGSAWLIQSTFMSSKVVGEWSKKKVDQLSAWF